jgi:hypothetical protein
MINRAVGVHMCSYPKSLCVTFIFLVMREYGREIRDWSPLYGVVCARTHTHWHVSFHFILHMSFCLNSLADWFQAHQWPHCGLVLQLDCALWMLICHSSAHGHDIAAPNRLCPCPPLTRKLLYPYPKKSKLGRNLVDSCPRLPVTRWCPYPQLDRNLVDPYPRFTRNLINPYPRFTRTHSLLVPSVYP